MTVTLPYAFARANGVLLLPEGQLAVRRGAAPAALVEARRVAGVALMPEVHEAAAFDRLLGEVYATDGLSAAADAAAASPLSAFALESRDLLDQDDAAPVIRLINALVTQAVQAGASDIHIEPGEASCVIRLRRDGQMSELLRLEANVAPMLVSRVKVMARLDISERRLPQDGRIGLALANRNLDVRVSTLPARGGERVVLRILDQAAVALRLDDLGMDSATEAGLRAALGSPNGIILVTGPTGAGKTTTLYAALKLLNDGARNIMTVEDPVEYAVDGVGQTQIDPRVGLTFAAGLRAILRQDPDVVMVGEIRDRETAEIAVQAALTGHLVLSTVHANSAAGAVTRLRDFGVEPFLIAACLRASLAQRLVRRVCACAEVAPAGAAWAARLGIAAETLIAHPAGCQACRHTGYVGRSGLYELLRVDAAVRDRIHAGGAESALGAGASVDDAARAAVLARVTTPEEVLRLMAEAAG
ncbi:GspE/PulE family protein [Sandaracinobacteroides saxicola]|uniref:General secretion pathway protein E n=1 Tax=Sandaracinobacteroides saxicola TaxID=2759707 RepID=A0A7G5IEF2_9SPHN|nr:ATPase, T2SS/T4P/T4SS family [Sandaracinobacteroides saxicola]QMW21744.1 Flp pilus assembly complex ATPase component TadA [Sandaracinobacteroides saxicola]